jgi:hypothetical protein
MSSFSPENFTVPLVAHRKETDPAVNNTLTVQIFSFV